METKRAVVRTDISCNFSSYSKGAFIQVFLFLTFICSVSGYAQTKAPQTKGQFLAEKVPHNHDFTKINPDASYRPSHLIVRFSPDNKGSQRPVGEKQNVINALGGGTMKRNLNASKGSYLIELPENLTVEEALKIYNARDDILYAEPDYEVRAISTIPNDAQFSELWGMHNTGQSGGTVDADIDAPEVWDIKTNAENIIVAVIDTGVDYNHEDLHENMWTNTAELPANGGQAGVDDDGNGYIDDIYGYDFAYYDSDPMDGHSHGTHCAGTIGAVGNNSTGVAGVCWNVKIMAVKFLDDGGSGWTDDAVLAVQYATMMGARVLLTFE